MASQIYQEKLDKFRDAINFRKTKTVPNLSNIFAWQIHDSGYSYEEAFYDWKKMKKVLIEFHKRYDFDVYQDNEARNAFPFTDALGGGGYRLDKETGGINVIDNPLIFPEDYHEYAKDPAKFMYKTFQRKYSKLTTPMFEKALMQFLRFGRYAAGIDKVFLEEIQRPLAFSLANAVFVPLETLNSGLRGIKWIAMDIRRNREELKVFCEANWEKVALPGFRRVLEGDQSNYVVNFFTAVLAHSFLSVKQFEEFYWPYLKRIVDMVAAAGKTIMIYCENEILRFAEFFQELPKGTAIVHLEMDDIFEARKRFPNLCLAGGFPIDLLGHGTPERCVDYAKRLIDGMGEGFILSQTKMACFPGDCRRENLLAVNDFARGYSS